MEEVDIDAVQTATDLAEIAYEVPALIQYKSQTLDLSDYATSIFQQLLERYPAVVSRLEEIDAIENGDEPLQISAAFGIEHKFRMLTNNILVVQLESLDSVLSEIHQSVITAKKDLKRIARLEADFESRKKRLVSVG